MRSRLAILLALAVVAGGVGLVSVRHAGDQLAVIEACQGLLIANYCQEIVSHEAIHLCAFHQAMSELHTVTVAVLSKWTVQDLIRKPASSSLDPGMDPPCKMAFPILEDLPSPQDDLPSQESE